MATAALCLPLLLLPSPGYIPPAGNDLLTATLSEPGKYAGVHIDLLASSLRLLSADGRAAVSSHAP